MIEFYIERRGKNDDLLSLSHLRSICRWEKKFKEILSLENVTSLSLASFVALYSSKTDCQLITNDDIENFRQVLDTCLPYYSQGYMDIPFSEIFLNRVRLEHETGDFTYQEQSKAIYTALRHTCFYKNITRFIFDHFLDRKFLEDLREKKSERAKVALSMIYLSNYQAIPYNRTRDQTMCLRRQPFSRKYCRERGCVDDYRNGFVDNNCRNEGPPMGSCERYCHCKYQCLNETESVVLLKPILKGVDFVRISQRFFYDQQQLNNYQDESIRLIALNFANVREQAAMARIYRGNKSF